MKNKLMFIGFFAVLSGGMTKASFQSNDVFKNLYKQLKKSDQDIIVNKGLDYEKIRYVPAQNQFTHKGKCMSQKLCHCLESVVSADGQRPGLAFFEQIKKRDVKKAEAISNYQQFIGLNEKNNELLRYAQTAVENKHFDNLGQHEDNCIARINAGYYSTLIASVAALQSKRIAASSGPQITVYAAKGSSFGGKFGLGVAAVTAGGIAYNNYTKHENESLKYDEIAIKIARDNQRAHDRLVAQHTKNMAVTKANNAACRDIIQSNNVVDQPIKVSTFIENNVVGSVEKKQPQSSLQWLQAHTWEAKPFGLTHGGKVATTGALAVIAGGVSYAGYKAYIHRAAIRSYVSAMNPFKKLDNNTK